MLLEVMDFVMERPVVVALVLVMIYRFIKARRPLPDYGGNITVVRTAGEWSALQARRTMSTGSPHIPHLAYARDRSARPLRSGSSASMRTRIGAHRAARPRPSSRA